MSVTRSLAFLDELGLTPTEELIGHRIVKEMRERLTFLDNVGVGYLQLDRAAKTLSGGEAQRLRLATQIGSQLVGVLYILDEPSIGLHQRDNGKLIGTLQRLKDLGNTVLVVEHDEQMMRTADHLVDMGPGAGEHGGYVVAEGTADDVMQNKRSVTGQFLSGKRTIAIPPRREDDRGHFTVRGAAMHNLKGIDVEFPVGKFVCVTGVSGSGKSTLVNEIVYKACANRLNRMRVKPGAHDDVEGIEVFDKVIDIDQKPIGRTPRSNPATYIDLFTHIRELYSLTPEAKVRGYKPGRFSFNVRGGRCETCKGDGTIKIEMHFLPDVYVQCETCHGHRYNKETLEVRFKGKSIADVLEMSVEEALGFFAKIPKLHRRLQTLHDVGLDYVKLGQPATTLSGGEAQRVKLAAELCKVATGQHALHPRRADDRPPLRRHREAARGAAAARRRGQHRARDRAQPRRDQAGRLGRRPRPGGRRGRRRADRGRNARADRRDATAPSPGSTCAGCSRPAASRSQSDGAGDRPRHTELDGTAASDNRRAPRPVPGAARCRPAVRDAEPVGRGLGAASRLVRLRGARDDERRLRLGARQARPDRHPRRARRSRRRALGRDGPAAQRRQRALLPGRSRRRRRDRGAARRRRSRRLLDRGLRPGCRPHRRGLASPPSASPSPPRRPRRSPSRWC